MKSLSKYIAFALLFCGISVASAQGSLNDGAAKKAAEVSILVNSGRYIFKLEKANLKTADIPDEAYGTDLDISKDTLIAYLPGLGKTPGAPVSADASGITCIHFSYNMTPATGGGYDVLIIPAEKYNKNVKDIKNISIHISKMGYADIKVTTINQGMLQYHGYITQPQALFPSNQEASTY